MISRLFLRVTNFQVLFANFFGSKIDYLALLNSNFMYIFEENYLNLILEFKHILNLNPKINLIQFQTGLAVATRLPCVETRVGG